mgnify:FL=1
MEESGTSIISSFPNTIDQEFLTKLNERPLSEEDLKNLIAGIHVPRPPTIGIDEDIRNLIKKILTIIFPPPEQPKIAKPELFFDINLTEYATPLFIKIPMQKINNFSIDETYQFYIKNETNSILFSLEPVIIKQNDGYYTEEISLPLEIPSSSYTLFINDIFIKKFYGICDAYELLFDENGQNIKKIPEKGICWWILETNTQITPLDSILDIIYFSDEWENYCAFKVDGSLNPCKNEGSLPTIKIVWDEHPISTCIINGNQNNIYNVYNEPPSFHIETDSKEPYYETRVVINNTELRLIVDHQTKLADNYLSCFNQLLDTEGSGKYIITISNTQLKNWREKKSFVILKGLRIEFCNLSHESDFYVPTVEEPLIDVKFSSPETLFITSNSLEKPFCPDGFRFTGKRTEQLSFNLKFNIHQQEQNNFTLFLDVPELVWKFKSVNHEWNRKQILITQDDYENLDIYRYVEIKINGKKIDSGSLFYLENPECKITRKFQRGKCSFPLGTLDFFISQSEKEDLQTMFSYYRENNQEINIPIFNLQIWRVKNWNCSTEFLNGEWIINLTWDENFQTQLNRTIHIWSDETIIQTIHIPIGEYRCQTRLSEDQFKELDYYYIQYIRGDFFDNAILKKDAPNVFKFFHADPQLERIVSKLAGENTSDVPYFSALTDLLLLSRQDPAMVETWHSITNRFFIKQNRIDFFIKKLDQYSESGVQLHESDYTIIMSVLNDTIIPFLLHNTINFDNPVSNGIINLFNKIIRNNTDSFKTATDSNPTNIVLSFFLASSEFLSTYINKDIWTPFAQNTSEKDQQVCIRKMAHCVDNARYNDCLQAINEIFKYVNKTGHIIQSDELLFYLILVYQCINKSFHNGGEIDQSVIRNVLNSISSCKCNNELVTCILSIIHDFNKNDVFDEYTDDLTRDCAKTIGYLKEICRNEDVC